MLALPLTLAEFQRFLNIIDYVNDKYLEAKIDVLTLCAAITSC